MNDIMTLNEVADYMRVHPSTVYRMLKRKELPAFRLGREWRFNRESIDTWRKNLENNGSSNTNHA